MVLCNKAIDELKIIKGKMNRVLFHKAVACAWKTVLLLCNKAKRCIKLNQHL